MKVTSRGENNPWLAANKEWGPLFDECKDWLLHISSMTKKAEPSPEPADKPPVLLTSPFYPMRPWAENPSSLPRLMNEKSYEILICVVSNCYIGGDPLPQGKKKNPNTDGLAALENKEGSCLHTVLSFGVPARIIRKGPFAHVLFSSQCSATCCFSRVWERPAGSSPATFGEILSQKQERSRQ